MTRVAYEFWTNLSKWDSNSCLNRLMNNLQDPEAVEAYLKFFDNDEQKVIELALIMINGIQARHNFSKA